MPCFIFLASIFLLAFWQFRYTEFHPVRRAFSVGNRNDFSWRNRLAAWESSLAMMADRPLLGFGWNQAESAYDQFYRAPKISEGMAIQLNHYFTLGMSLGLPALICFGMYVGLSLTRNGEGESGEKGKHSSGEPPHAINIQLPTSKVCRAAAVVVLVGLWFDGGLFNLATAAPLWVLLELGRGSQVRGFRCGVSDTKRQRSQVSGFAVPAFLAVLLLTGLFWAKAREPFHRERFSIQTDAGERTEAVVVMPKRGGPFPVAIWSHGSGGSVESSGEVLRAFASSGMAAIGFNYDQTNQAGFDAQMTALLDRVTSRSWARSNSIAWTGSSLGAQRQLSFLVRHPERQPAALVRLNGGMIEELRGKAEGGNIEKLRLNCRVWMSHGENDEVFPVADARKVAAALEAAGAVVKLDVFPGRGHQFGEDQPLLVKAAAEFCAGELKATARVSDNGRRALWFYWVPVGLMGIGFLVWRWIGQREVVREVESARWLRWVAGAALFLATVVSAAHLALPLLHANPRSLNLARQWCVRPNLRADFDWLTQQPAAKNYRIKELLEHLNLASLQRDNFTPALSEESWREFVLSPWISEKEETIGWRRELWESLAPRVRRETDAEMAAQIVVRELRKRVGIVADGSRAEILEAWSQGACNREVFEKLYVASLRSISVPARLNAQGACELRVGEGWRLAPRSILER